MKRLFSPLLLMVACSYSFATVRTLCNAPYSPGQFTTFNDAQTASSNGDTIYVHGSPIDYGNITITKSLVIIGTGHNPNKQNPLVSTFLNVLVNANNVQLIGVHTQHLGTATGADNCVIKKCRISGSLGWAMVLQNTSGWIIEGNIIESVSLCIYFGFTPSNNTHIRYNVLLAPNNVWAKIGGLSNSAADRTYIINNVFLGPLSGNTFAFEEVDYCSIDNNIFYNCIPDGNSTANLESCTMNNNMSYGSMNNNFFQSGTNNLAGVDPQFVNYTGPTTFYDYLYDLSLQPTSPGHNTGTDATDRGVYGGTANPFTETGEPSIAEITDFTITSPTTIAPGGTLTISITSKRVP